MSRAPCNEGLEVHGSSTNINSSHDNFASLGSLVYKLKTEGNHRESFTASFPPKPQHVVAGFECIFPEGIGA